MIDFFLNPNVAYLVLVLAFLLTIMALLIPGTGIIEVFALSALAWSGYAAYKLTINYWALAILVLGVVPFFLALRKWRNPVYLLVTIVALVVGSAFLFKGEGWKPAVNPFFSLVVSVLVAGFVWVTTRKAMEASMAPRAHDPDKVIGRIGEANTEIYNEGSVQLESELWSARSELSIPAGTRVRVVRREGLTLIVEKA
jgi:membrane-bound serine protease (ClpP class)